MPWIVAKIKPNQDKIALSNIDRQEFIFFQPTFKTTIKVKNEFKEVIKPVFPGYIFIEINDMVTDSHKINYTRGISKLITFGNTIPIITCELIKDLKAHFSLINNLEKKITFKKGMKVEVTNGPFAKLYGNILDTTADHRIWILLDILGKQTKVSIENNNLRIRS